MSQETGGGPRRLTPSDVEDVVFSVSPDACGGYDEGEVDAFLEQVVDELTLLREERDAARAAVRPGAQRQDGSPAHDEPPTGCVLDAAEVCRTPLRSVAEGAAAPTEAEGASQGPASLTVVPQSPISPGARWSRGRAARERKRLALSPTRRVR